MDIRPAHVNSRPPVVRHSEIPPSPVKTSKVKKNKTKLIVIVIGLITALALMIAGAVFILRGSTASSIDGGKYQAVFMTNGQVYFGKLQIMNDEYMKLNDIYYLQAKEPSTNPQETTSSTAADVTLVKLGNEIHGPDDQMIISKNQILFFENLKKDSKVSDSISQYQESQKK